MLELDHKKAERQRIDAFELWCWRRLFKEIKLVNPKGDQYWIFIGGADAEVETTILWPPDVKSWLTGKDPDAGKDWGQEERDDRDGWMASSTQWTLSLSKLWEIVKDRGAWCVAVHRVTEDPDTTKQLNDKDSSMYLRVAKRCIGNLLSKTSGYKRQLVLYLELFCKLEIFLSFIEISF